MHQKVEAKASRGLVPEVDDFLEFPCRIDVKKGKRWLLRPERLSRQMQDDCRILSRRIEKHKFSELRRGFTKDKYALGF
jgi:hypothetical protein